MMVSTALCIIGMIEKDKQIVLDKFKDIKSNEEFVELSWKEISKMISATNKYLEILKKSVDKAEFEFYDK